MPGLCRRGARPRGVRRAVPPDGPVSTAVDVRCTRGGGRTRPRRRIHAAVTHSRSAAHRRARGCDRRGDARQPRNSRGRRSVGARGQRSCPGGSRDGTPGRAADDGGVDGPARRAHGFGGRAGISPGEPDWNGRARHASDAAVDASPRGHDIHRHAAGSVQRRNDQQSAGGAHAMGARAAARGRQNLRVAGRGIRQRKRDRRAEASGSTRQVHRSGRLGGRPARAIAGVASRPRRSVCQRRSSGRRRP